MKLARSPKKIFQVLSPLFQENYLGCSLSKHKQTKMRRSEIQEMGVSEERTGESSQEEDKGDFRIAVPGCRRPPVQIGAI